MLQIILPPAAIAAATPTVLTAVRVANIGLKTIWYGSVGLGIIEASGYALRAGNFVTKKTLVLVAPAVHRLKNKRTTAPELPAPTPEPAPTPAG